MSVQTSNVVSLKAFREKSNQYVEAIRSGHGPIAIRQNAEIVGFFVGREEYEALLGAAVKKLLSSRAQGPTVSHAEVQRRARKVIRSSQGKARNP